jgi:hypothetical protein
MKARLLDERAVIDLKSAPHQVSFNTPYPLTKRPFIQQLPFPFNNPLLFVIPSVGWASGPPMRMKMASI